jgi:hypothetical protein
MLARITISTLAFTHCSHGQMTETEGTEDKIIYPTLVSTTVRYLWSYIDFLCEYLKYEKYKLLEMPSLTSV